MKLKFLSSLALMVSLGLMYVAMSSNSGGKYNGGTSCGSCHGSSASSATTVALTGLPTSFITGQVYTLTFTVTNSTNVQSGFNIQCSAGQFTAGTGSKTNTAKTQITHDATSTTNSFTFTWTAPSTTSSVSFNCVGNAVNGNNNDDSGDQWKNISYTVPGAFPTSVSDIANPTLTIYPNPATTEIRIQGAGQTASVNLRNAFGQFVNCPSTVIGSDCIVNLSSLPSGLYIVSVNHNGKVQSAQLVKN